VFLAQHRQSILQLLRQREHHNYYFVIVLTVGTPSAASDTFRAQLRTFDAKHHSHCSVLERQLLAKYG
jgi:hypothetical protein